MDPAVAAQRDARDRKSSPSIIVGVSWIAFALAYGPLFSRIGITVQAFSLVPLVLTGFLLGIHAGILGGIFNIVLNAFLVQIVGGNAWSITMATLPGGLSATAVGAFAGWFGTLYQRAGQQARDLARDRAALQAEIDRRIRVEADLEQARRELEERVRQRTADLEEAKERYRRSSEVISDYTFSVIIGSGTRPRVEWATGLHLRPGGLDPGDVENWEQIVHPDDKPIVLNLIRGSDQPNLTDEIRIVKAGVTRWLHVHIRADSSLEGQARRYYIAAQDITDRKATEGALRASEARSKALVNAIPDMMVRMNREGVVLDFKPGQRSRVDGPFDWIIGKDVDQVLADQAWMPAGTIRRFFEVLRAALAEGQSRTFESEVPFEGGVLHYETRLVVSGEDEVLGIVRDITERKLAETERQRLFDQIRVGRERLIELSQKLVEMQEVERREIARELHDQVGQNLTGLSINLNIIRSQLSPESSAKVDVRIADSLKLVDATVEQVRDVMAELRPAVLDDYGLAPALRWLAKRFSERTRLDAQVSEDSGFERLPIDKETALFRIAQEALNNAAKYARAAHVSMTLEMVDRLARLTVVDDGVGFDPAAPRRVNGRMSWGLSLMRERARGVGGELYIRSAAGEGTRIIAEVPA